MEAKEKEFVKHLGEKIGYGNMMYLASECWKENMKKNGYPTSGVFIPALPSRVCESKKLPDTESNCNIPLVSDSALNDAFKKGYKAAIDNLNACYKDIFD